MRMCSAYRDDQLFQKADPDVCQVQFKFGPRLTSQLLSIIGILACCSVKAKPCKLKTSLWPVAIVQEHG